MSNEFFIPVGRRYETTRAAVEARLETGTAEYEGETITWVDSGYAGDDESIMVMTPDGARCHARRALLRPGTEYDRVVIVDENDNVLIGRTDLEAWAQVDVNQLIRIADISSIYENATGYLNLANNFYSVQPNERYIANGPATRYQQGNGQHTFYTYATGVADAAGAPLTNLRMTQTLNIFNINLIDMDFRVCTDNEAYTIFAEGEVDCVGMGTGTPLLNIGSATGDLNRATNRGLHILGDTDNGDYAYLIVEGQGDAGNGFSGEGAAHILLAAMNAGDNVKIWDIRHMTRTLEFRSLNDDLTEKIGDILNLDGLAGNVMIGATAYQAACVRNLVIAEGTAPGGATADQCYMWAQDDTGTAEMYVADGAGNQLKISSHNDLGDWEISYKNLSTGKRVQIDMEKFMRWVDKKFKTDFYHLDWDK